MSDQESKQFSLLQLLSGVAVIAIAIALTKLLFDFYGSRDAFRLVGAAIFEVLVSFCTVTFFTNRPSTSKAATVAVSAAFAGVFVLFAVNGYFNGFFLWDSRIDAGAIGAIQSPLVVLTVTIMGGWLILWPPVVVLGMCAGLVGRLANQRLLSATEDQELRNALGWFRTRFHATGIVLIVLLVVVACVAVSPRVHINSRNAVGNSNGAPAFNNQLASAAMTSAAAKNTESPPNISAEAVGISTKDAPVANEHALQSGRSGVVREKLADGSIGSGIPNARIIFARDDGQLQKEVTSGSRGRFRIQIPEGWYRISITRENFEDYQSGRFYHRGDPGYQGASFFLRPTVDQVSEPSGNSEEMHEKALDGRFQISNAEQKSSRPRTSSGVHQSGATDVMREALGDSQWRVGKHHFGLKKDGSVGGPSKRFKDSYWEITGPNSIAITDQGDESTFLRIKLQDGYRRGDAAWKDGTKRPVYRQESQTSK